MTHEESITTIETASFNRERLLESQRTFAFSRYEEIRNGLEVVVMRAIPEVRIFQHEKNEYKGRFVTLDREEARRVVEVIQGWLGEEK